MIFGNTFSMWAEREVSSTEHDSQDFMHPTVLLLPKCRVDTVL